MVSGSVGCTEMVRRALARPSTLSAALQVPARASAYGDAPSSQFPVAAFQAADGRVFVATNDESDLLLEPCIRAALA